MSDTKDKTAEEIGMVAWYMDDVAEGLCPKKMRDKDGGSITEALYAVAQAGEHISNALQNIANAIKDYEQP